jgi:adenosylcobinamide-GDP ribazoletransferase
VEITFITLIKLSIVSIKSQVNLCYLALSFFTRLPVPKTMHYSPALLNQANRYFSLVGLLVGGILGLCFLLLSFCFPLSISVLLTMMISLLLTGAFHEDGLADMADGVGGAFEIKKRLAIMKDSRLGTYGAATLFLALLLKFQLLLVLAENSMWLVVGAIILAASLSRAVAGSFISSLPYVSDDEGSKSKPLAQAQSTQELYILLGVGLIPLVFFPMSVIVITLVVLLLFRWYFKSWLLKRLGGFTGDCLGAAQQLSELLIYLVLVAYFVDNISRGVAQ